MSVAAVSFLEEVKFTRLIELNYSEQRLARNFEVLVEFIRHNHSRSEAQLRDCEEDIRCVREEAVSKAELGPLLDDALARLRLEIEAKSRAKHAVFESEIDQLKAFRREYQKSREQERLLKEQKEQKGENLAEPKREELSSQQSLKQEPKVKEKEEPRSKPESRKQESRAKGRGKEEPRESKNYLERVIGDKRGHKQEAEGEQRVRRIEEELRALGQRQELDKAGAREEIEWLRKEARRSQEERERHRVGVEERLALLREGLLKLQSVQTQFGVLLKDAGELRSNSEKLSRLAQELHRIDLLGTQIELLSRRNEQLEKETSRLRHDYGNSTQRHQDDREALFRKHRELESGLESQQLQLHALEVTLERLPKLDIEGEFDLIKERLTDLEEGVLKNTLEENHSQLERTLSVEGADSPSPPGRAEGSASIARIMDRINKNQGFMLNLARRDEVHRDLAVLGERLALSEKQTSGESADLKQRQNQFQTRLNLLGQAVRAEGVRELERRFGHQLETLRLKLTDAEYKTMKTANASELLRNQFCALRDELVGLRSPLRLLQKPDREELPNATSLTVFKRHVYEDSPGVEEVKKELLLKIQEVRSEVVQLSKELHRKAFSGKSLELEVRQVQARSDEMRTIVGKKADMADTRKYLQFLQNKLSHLIGLMAKSGTQPDEARGARKNWFCLSCDKLLANYTGKLGKPAVWDALPARRSSLTLYKREEEPK